MKIALVIEHFDATRGGAEHVAVWLAGQLARQGHEVHVLCHNAKRRLQVMKAAHQGASHDAWRSEQSHGREEAEAPDGVTVHKLKGFKLSTGLGFKRFGLKAKAWCERHQPDVAHSLTVAWAGDIYHPEAGVYARMQEQAVASRSNKRAAAIKRWMQRLNGKQRVLRTLEEKAVGGWEMDGSGGAWKIISISGGMTREFREHYGLAEERMVRLDNPRTKPLPEVGQAEEHRAWFRAHYGLGAEDKVALFVGHDFRRKGLGWAIEGIGRTKDWKLVVVGLGKVREYFEMTERLGLGDRVKFVGPTREVERLYCAGDVLLLPVFYDPAPLVVIEALACGLPVISTRNLGSADIVEASGAGVIVESPRDTAGIAAALEGVATEGKAREELHARARKAAEGLPGEVFVEKVVALYEACAAAKRKASKR